MGSIMEKLDDYLVTSKDVQKIFDVDFFMNKAAKTNAGQELLGISDEVLERYYLAASHLLEQKDWKKARDAFLFLTFLNPLLYNFWLGLGIAEQCQEHYEAALTAYIIAEAIDPSHPVAHANSFQCNAAIHEPKAAENSLQLALEACGDREEFSDLKNQLLAFEKQMRRKT